MDYLRKLSEDTFLFLNICSFLSTSIQNSIICKAPGFQEETPGETEERVEDAKILLASFSMLDLMDDGVRIHVLVQEAVIFHSSIEEKTVGLSNGASILHDSYNALEKETDPQPLRNCFVHSEAMIHKFHRLLADHIAQVNTSDLKNSYFTLSFPFLSTVFDLSVKVSESFLDKMLEIVEQCFGASSKEIALVIRNVALVLGQQGNHSKEKSLLEREIEIEVVSYGEGSIHVAETLGNLGSCYGDLGDHQRMKEMLERALKVKETFYGETHVEVARTLNNLGSCYGYLGDHQRKKEMLERALQILQTFYGETHVEVAMTLGNLGSCYGALGDHQRKKKMLERALKILQTFYGETHVEVAKTLVNLGICYGALGDHQREKEMLERALQILQTFYGETHVEVAITLGNLGICYGALGDHQRKKEMLERALQILQTFYGETNVEVAMTLNNLGNCYCSLKMYPESIAVLKRAIEIFERGSPVVYLCCAYRNISESLFEESHDPVNLLAAKEYLEKELVLLSDNLHGPVLQNRITSNLKLQENVDILLRPSN